MEGWGAREEEGKRGREGGSKRCQRLPTFIPFLIAVTVTDTNTIAVTATITVTIMVTMMVTDTATATVTVTIMVTVTAQTFEPPKPGPSFSACVWGCNRRQMQQHETLNPQPQSQALIPKPDTPQS